MRVKDAVIVLIFEWEAFEISCNLPVIKKCAYTIKYSYICLVYMLNKNNLAL